MPVSVRRAEKADAGKVAEFAVALADQHFGYDPVRFSRIVTVEGADAFYSNRIAAGNAVVFVAEIDGTMVGFAYMEYEPIIYTELATNVAWLHDIYIEPDSQRSGAGRELIEAVANEAKLKGANKVLLSVAFDNAKARNFFESIGFRTTMQEMMLAIE